jgi:kinesin family protein 5
LAADADFGDCVELQPELKRLKLRKNNWESETYEFDEVLTEFASQKRVYEVVAKPVVESVLEGYNGTVMAYGQTGTGKTFTLGRLGEEDTAARGIMVRAMEDILADITPETDTVSVSYLQVCDSRSSHGIVYTFSNFNVWLSCSCVVVNVYYVYYCSCIWK